MTYFFCGIIILHFHKEMEIEITVYYIHHGVAGEVGEIKGENNYSVQGM